MTERAPGPLPTPEDRPMNGQEALCNTNTPMTVSDDNESEAENKERFQVELEFVQCLANPHYLHYLALNRYLEDPTFLSYLNYLLYWKDPMYAKYIIYPHCLTFLELLQNATFRRDLINPKYVDLLHTQQFYHWQFHRHNSNSSGSGTESTSPSAAAAAAAMSAGALSASSAAPHLSANVLGQPVPGLPTSGMDSVPIPPRMENGH